MAEFETRTVRDPLLLIILKEGGGWVGMVQYSLRGMYQNFDPTMKNGAKMLKNAFLYNYKLCIDRELAILNMHVLTQINL